MDATDPAALARFWADALGVEVGEHSPDHPWVVLADPEGNLFCVLAPR